MEPILCYPDPPPSEVVRALELAGYSWEAVGDEAAANDGLWSAAIVAAEEEAEAAFAFARALRNADASVAPVLLLVRGSALSELETRHELFDDFCVTPFHPVEFEARLRHLIVRGGWSETPTELVTYGELVLNLETYQAIISGRPLDLTYMEYELLKFLASNPGRVFTRETLLSRVWGYEYYGGARTVDVHVRRLRSKLGEEHAALIQTVRSVGYKFGESRWGA
ncbi:MAG TPA: response regulator transcription factor [Microthrixaceae bacterium]|nr:response regulator transcription factor [Microthrixaceae bacterium]